MAPSLCFLLSMSLIIQGQGFSSTSTGIQSRSCEASFLSSSNDAAFSAFADSLEEEPEAVKEQPWQAKLEDLLDPQTNLADVRDWDCSMFDTSILFLTPRLRYSIAANPNVRALEFE